MKLILSALLVFLLSSISSLSTGVMASSLHSSDNPYAKAEQIAVVVAKDLALDLSEKIFQGEIFSQPMSAWQFDSAYGFDSFVKDLSRQKIIQQYHGLGNLIMLSGDYEQHSVLMHVERVGADAYRGFLSVMPSQALSFALSEVEQFQQYLLKQPATLEKSRVSWLPLSAVLLLDIKSAPDQSQQIYLDPMPLELLQQEVLSNLKDLGWQKNIVEDLGLSLWTKGSQQLRLFFSQQAEGTALYVLTQDLTKEAYENTHE